MSSEEHSTSACWDITDKRNVFLNFKMNPDSRVKKKTADLSELCHRAGKSHLLQEPSHRSYPCGRSSGWRRWVTLQRKRGGNGLPGGLYRSAANSQRKPVQVGGKPENTGLKQPSIILRLVQLKGVELQAES